jgi:hypothetical protein
MGALQATWHPDGRLLFWAAWGSLDEAVAHELPELDELKLDRGHEVLADPTQPGQRRRVAVRSARAGRVARLMPALRRCEELSDSIRCWAMATRLGLELAGRQAVVPTVIDGHARWRALLNRPEDQARLVAVAEALPVAGRLVPTRERGPAMLQSSMVVVRAFIDSIADSLYRTDAWPGPARSWSLELAQALRGAESAFQPRDARFFGVPAIVAAWSAEDAAPLRLGLRLHLPAGRADGFRLEVSLRPAHRGRGEIGAADAWRGGASMSLRGRVVEQPAWQLLRALARAQRVYAPLAACLRGPEPRDPVWSAREAWAFLDVGVAPLRDAGVVVELPEAFEAAGSRRIRARMRLESPGHGLVLGDHVPYRWEVVLGDVLLSGNEFADVSRGGDPVARFRGEWVLLDPAELARLPEGLPREGTLDAVTALRAVLTGQHEGVPVVTDDRLGMVVDALRSPPDRPAPAALNAALRPYQLRGFAWLACLGELGLGACLADDMGLGKTVQVIAHLLDRAERSPGAPSLVLCPTSVLGNWARELARFAPSLTVVAHHGSGRALEDARGADVVLTTYGLLVRDAAALQAVGWDVVVLDEAQAIKNPDSRRARAACGLTARHRVALSGTPVENRLDELWSLMRFLVPGLLGTRAYFQRAVAVPIERMGDEDAARRLRLGTSPFLLRRVKSDPSVVSDLPDKVQRKVWCALVPAQAALYHQVAEEKLAEVSEADGVGRRGRVLAMLTALKQVCNHPAHFLRDGDKSVARSGKLRRTVELLEAVLAADERALVFTQYREMGELLATALTPTVGQRPAFLHGGLSVAERDELVRRFQEDDDAAPVLIISLRAGGVGLNLTRATHVLHYDRWWNPAVEDQATDRAYRIGQRRNVLVHKLVCQGTLEERIDALLDDKRGLAEAVVGSGEGLVAELDDAALRALVLLGEDAVVEDE